MSLLADVAVYSVEYRLTNLAEITLGRINEAALRVVVKVSLWSLREMNAGVSAIGSMRFAIFR